ncbi:MAG: nucleotidyltransferase family protein [Actinomycetota bacterium]|nr:nucleotidyltransferase family protein [Actinomycetota bacterium]
MKVAGAILAGGYGSRYLGETHKLLAPFRGDTVLGHALRAARDSSIEDLAIVQGAIDLSWAIKEGETLLSNDDPTAGMASSLAVAIEWAKEIECDHIVVGLGDQPLVVTESWTNLAAAPTEARLVVATYGGKRRNPVRIAREIFALLPSTGEQGARPLMEKYPELVLELPCEGEPIDIDTVEELSKWNL